MIRVALAGAYGKTGAVVAEALASAADIEVVARLVKHQRLQAARDGSHPPEYDSIAQLKNGAAPHVLVDFTVFPDSKAIALAAIAAGIRPVIGTSGYKAEDVAELRQACEEAGIGAVLAPNFSPGAVLMMQFAQIAARYYKTAEILETHGSGKKDAPSGTSLATAEAMAKVGNFQRPAVQILKAPGARGADVEGVGIHSVRLPGVIAAQEVVLANDDELLAIRHVTSSRRAFVPGVLRAVHAVVELKNLVVGLETLLT